MSVVLPLLCSCSLIDDDMADCATTRTITVRPHTVAAIDSAVNRQVAADRPSLRRALTAYYEQLLSPSDHAVEASFYDAVTGEHCQTNRWTVAAEGSSFNVSLPVGALRCVGQTAGRPLLSGRLLLPAGDNADTLHLYPADAQVALVARVDTTIRDITVTASGTASSFNAADSTYAYAAHTDTLRLTPTAATDGLQAYTAALLPSAPDSTWQVVVYATTATGSVTRTVLTIQQTLRAGDICLLLVTIDGKGEAHTSQTGVGASVTLDWKRGGQYDPEI